MLLLRSKEEYLNATFRRIIKKIYNKFLIERDNAIAMYKCKVQSPIPYALKIPLCIQYAMVDNNVRMAVVFSHFAEELVKDILDALDAERDNLREEIDFDFGVLMGLEQN